MAATPKPVRKYAKEVKKSLDKKYEGMGMSKKHAKDIAKAHAEKGFMTKKGHLNTQKVKEATKAKAKKK